MFVCGDAREALHMVESHISLPPMTLGRSVTVSAWVREDSATLSRGLWFSSYESAACGDTDACRQASGGSLDSHGWLAIGHTPAASSHLNNWGDLYVPETVFPTATLSNFWGQAHHQWLHVSVVVSWTTVSVYSNGELQGVGTREAPLPSILRRENTFGGPFAEAVGLAEVSFADLRIYDRSLATAEATALFLAPAGECCIDAGLRMSFGVGDVDLTAAAMNAIDSPSAARVVPALMAHDSVDPGSTLQPCAATKSAAVREVDICGDTTMIEDCNGIVSDGVGPYIR